MKRTGRPPTKPAKLMDGFYIEVRNKGSRDKAVKIKSENREAMELTIKQYKKRKEVTVLGEYKNDEWVNK